MLVCMRTSMNLPDGLLEAARQRAARDGRTVTSLVEEGLRRVLSDEVRTRPLRLPTDGLPDGRFLVDIADRDLLWAELDHP